jgi:hypothetical protein
MLTVSKMFRNDELLFWLKGRVVNILLDVLLLREKREPWFRESRVEIIRAEHWGSFKSIMEVWRDVVNGWRCQVREGSRVRR